MFHQGLGLRDGLRFQRGDELWVKNSSILAVKPSWVLVPIEHGLGLGLRV